MLNNDNLSNKLIKYYIYSKYTKNLIMIYFWSNETKLLKIYYKTINKEESYVNWNESMLLNDINYYINNNNYIVVDGLSNLK